MFYIPDVLVNEFLNSQTHSSQESSFHHIFSKIDDLIFEGKLKLCDVLLSKIDESTEFNISSIIAILSATYLIRDELPSRSTLLTNSKIRFKSSYKNYEINELFKGLD